MSGQRKLLRDTGGAALVEFALIAPVLLMMILGMFDLGYNFYIQAQLQGAVQKAARDSTLEGAKVSDGTIDARVAHAVHELVPDAQLQFERRSYTNFSDVGEPEDFSDINGNGVCDDGEPFEDANANGIWDEDRGKQGGGGARDVVLYVVTITYTRAFGAAQLAGMGATATMEAATVLRNQPYAEQAVSVAVGNCP